MTVINQASGKNWQLFHGDCCEVTKDLPDNSIDFCIHSPPFSALYIYSDSESDMGNCADHEEFFRHYGYLIRELYRVMVTGRIVAIHCKDLPKYANRDGTSGLFDFPGMCIAAFEAAGFCFHSRVTIWKCPVTERERTNNNGLLHKTVKRDRSQIRQGMADYLIVMRKPPVGTLLSDKPIISNGFDEYIGSEDPRTTELKHPSKYARTGTLKAQSLNESDVAALAKEIQANAIEWGGTMEIGQATDEAVKRLQQSQQEANGSVTIWRRYAEPVWWDIDQTNVLNFKLATNEQDEKHICLARGSLVLTKERGHVEIQELEIGEHVLTHMGRWRPIIAKQMTASNARVVKVRAQGVHALKVTPTHKLWAKAIQADKNHRKRNARNIDPSWVEAKDLPGCYVNLKLPDEEWNDVDSQTWWIVGRWIADGHIAPRGTAHISIGGSKLESTMRKLGDRAGFSQELTATQVLIRDPDHQLRDILEQCGSGAKNKKLPPVAFTLPQDKAKALLDGYLSGDGHYDKSRDRWNICTVSRELAIGLQFLIQRAYGSVATIHAGRGNRTHVIEGRTVNASQEWCVSFNVGGYSFGFMADDGAWKPVKSVADAGTAETWNIRVLEDESYTAEGCIVKNCPLQIDVIKRSIQLWSDRDEVVLSPFAGIGSEGVGALEMGRKFIGIELKETYFNHAQKFLRVAESNARNKTATLFNDDDA